MQHKFIFTIVLLSILTSCTPHPGAGGWVAISDNAALERLEIRYNGQADLYTKTDDIDAAWRCFWAAKDKQTAHMKCVAAGQAGHEEIYWFTAAKDTREGTLLRGEQLVGGYRWQPPTDPPEE